jgi:hypothetical protein
MPDIETLLRKYVNVGRWFTLRVTLTGIAQETRRLGRQNIGDLLDVSMPVT